MSPQLSEILKLSIPERILWVEAIWNSIASEDDKSNLHKLSDEQINFLEEEMSSYAKNPKESSTWEDIKKRIPK